MSASSGDDDARLSGPASTRPLQHRAVLATPVTALDEAHRPTVGPIAVLPAPVQPFIDAIESAGGQVADVDDTTRAVLWRGGRAHGELTDFLTEHPHIQWVQLPSAGVERWQAAMRAHPDVLWTSAKGAYAQPVAEHALVLTLALLRSLRLRIEAQSWGDGTIGRSLYGLNVLVLGAGGIAREFLRLTAPFGTHSTVVRRSADPVDGAERTVQTDQLLDVLPHADVVVLAAALTDGTQRILGAPQFAAMKRDAVLVNIARGGLVDTDALVAALRDGTLGGAGLDVTDPEPLPDGHPLWTEPRCIITPHSADTPDMTDPLLAERVRRNVLAYLGDGRFEGVVDPIAGY